MDKTKTVAWMVAILLVLVIVLVAVVLSTKQTLVTSDGKVASITSTNLLKKS
jgi:hypothetical protein